MDKIFKNDTVMGIVAVSTLVVVGVMFYKQHYKKNTELSLGTTKPAVM